MRSLFFARPADSLANLIKLKVAHVVLRVLECLADFPGCTRAGLKAYLRGALGGSAFVHSSDKNLFCRAAELSDRSNGGCLAVVTVGFYGRVSTVLLCKMYANSFSSGNF